MLENPQFSIVKPYVLNFLKTNYWKVQNLMEFEDAVGEAQLQFWRTVLRLQTRHCIIENENHLMSLFKTSWSRHFITLANKSTMTVPIVQSNDEELNYIETTVIGDLDNDGYAQAVVSTAPDEIRQVLMLMQKIPADTLEQLVELVERDQLDTANMIVSRYLNKSAQQRVLHKTLEYLQN